MDLVKQILKTIIYYDIFNQPITIFEIWKYLINDGNNVYIKFEEIFDCLNKNDVVQLKIEKSRGFYFLKGRNNIVDERFKKQKIAIKKFNIIKKYKFIFEGVPFLKSVFISGSLAQETVNENSDIDFLLIAKNGRIWTCRFFLVLFARLFKKYRHGKVVKDKFCFNHFITDKSLEIKNQSLYNAQTYAHFYELGNKNYLKDFYKANLWMKNYLANFNPDLFDNSQINIKSCYCVKLLRKIIEFILNNWIGDIFETFSRAIQTYFIKKNPLTRGNIEKGLILYNNNCLEFHPDSIEEFIMKKYNDKLKEMIKQK